MSNTPFLDKYTDNLTEKVARKIENFKVIGRDKEIEAVFIALSSATKNSPLLIGDAGVGKTAIVEGVAAMIVKNEVPARWQNVQVRLLELSTLMSDEDGGFTIKFKHIINELKENKARNILFIDEIHTIMGAGNTQGALDAANIIKPALARGEIQLIGATTLDEFQDYIEEDQAMQRRFQQVLVLEPSTSEAIAIMNGIKLKFENVHGVKIKPSAVKASVHLSQRFIPELYLPDKAIDLIDAASARAAFSGKTSINEEDIAIEIQRKKNVPITTIIKDEDARLDDIEAFLKQRVKGQDEAVASVSRAVNIARAGLHNEKKPKASFMFLGTTGVGKTELAKSLAEVLFGDEDAMIRIDMSEYSQPGSSVKLIGTRKTKGTLADKVKNRPYSVVLFDEVEKGNQEAHDLLLQILDDGRLSDSRGRTISFKNTYVILTTNAGAKTIMNHAEIHGTDLNEREQLQRMQAIQNALMSDFRPEFLNRIGDKIIFNMLDKAVIREIAVKNLEQVQKRLKKQVAGFIYDDALLDYLVDNGSDKSNGARPIERFINTKITAELANILLSNSGKAVVVIAKIIGQAPREFEAMDKRQIVFEVDAEPL